MFNLGLPSRFYGIPLTFSTKALFLFKFNWWNALSCFYGISVTFSTKTPISDWNGCSESGSNQISSSPVLRHCLGWMLTRCAWWVRSTKYRSASPSSHLPFLWLHFAIVISRPMNPFIPAYPRQNRWAWMVGLPFGQFDQECNFIPILCWCSVLLLASSHYQLLACPFGIPASYFHTVISDLPSQSNMMKSLNCLLSLSSLFALSRPGNGALLPPPGARSIPIEKRDGAQPVRRQDCPAPGLEVDQAQVTHTPSNLYNSKFANGWPVWKKSSSQTYAIRIRKMISSPAIMLCELFPIPPFALRLWQP